MAIPDYVQRRRDGFDVDALLTDSEGATLTTSGNTTTAVEVGVGAEFEVVVDADTITGTSPTMDIAIQGATDAAFTTPVEIASFPQIDDSVDPIQHRMAFKSEHEFIRAAWTLAGTTPSFATTISLRN
jgi:hypothetical protein